MEVMDQEFSKRGPEI